MGFNVGVDLAARRGMSGYHAVRLSATRHAPVMRESRNITVPVTDAASRR